MSASSRSMKIIKTASAGPTLNWEKCIICQKDSRQPLITPTDHGYQSLSDDLIEYAKYDSIPLHMNFENTFQTIQDNKAKYHKTCRLKYNSLNISRFKDKLSKIANAEEKMQPDPNADPFQPVAFIRTRSKNPQSSDTPYQQCLFCEKPETAKEHLVSVSTLKIGPDIHRYALLLQDESLMKKLHSTDLVAMEAKYHKVCYVRLLNKVRSMTNRQSFESESSTNESAYGSIFSELVSQIQETYLYSTEAPVFRLVDLVAKFQQRGQQLCLYKIDVNRTRLKEELLQFIPGLRENKVGREIYLYFEDDVRHAVASACEYSEMSDGMCLARAAKIIRKQMLQEYPKFNGSFEGEFNGENCVSKQCVMFCRMVLEGAINESMEFTDEDSQTDRRLVATNIAQLMRFNCKKTTVTQNKNMRHIFDRETPLPLYVGIKLYNAHARKDVIDKMCELGLSVSYHRINQVVDMVTSSACEHYNKQGFVCPQNIEKNVFTCAAIDNIDHNTSSNTSLDSFHGTSISLIVQPEEKNGQVNTTSINMIKKDKYELSLPDSYNNIPPTQKQQSDVPMQTINYEAYDQNSLSSVASIKEWLDHVKMALKNDEEFLPWAAYCSRKENPERKIVPCSSVILPVLRENINSHAMVRHTMDIIITATNKINPGQIPVITADQPVYAIAKQIQWSYPDSYGENKLVVMLGPLHIEMAVLSMIGTWLEGSGWTDNLIEAGVTTTGRAEGILKSFHVKKSRYAHEVTAAALSALIEEAFNVSDNTNDESFVQWVERKKNESSQFKFWHTTMELEAIMMSLVASVRQGDIADFITSLHRICPWMFSLDRVNYARWLPIFVHDLEKLPISHPMIYKEFEKGHFTCSKTKKMFSRMGQDQIHEQNNKLIKLDSKTLSALSNDNALLRWSVSGPEMVRMTSEYEEKASFHQCSSSEDHKHREDTKAFVLRFHKDVNNLIKVFKEHGNPFEDSHLTTVNNTRLIMNDKSEKSVFEAESRGNEQYTEFVKERLILRNKSIHVVIKRNNLSIFSNEKAVAKSKDKQKIGDLKKDSNMFCKLYVASQGRNADVDVFFSHENHPYAPSISEFGQLRKPSNKSDIVSCIEDYCSKQDNISITIPTTSKPEASCLVIDGAALVHMLNPKANQTFQQYIENVFVPYVKGRLRFYDRIDVVFDQYIEGSLKAHTRDLRGTGNQVAVRETVKIPKNFKKFLAHDKNKEHLFKLLAKKLVEIQVDGKTVNCTSKEKVLSSSGAAVEMLSSSHEEADARLILHAANAARNNHNSVIIKTVDSDVLVIALFAFSKIPELQKLWIEYGTGKNLRYLPVHDFCTFLPNEMSNLMPLFHAFTGCDTVSAFCGIGKKSAWKTWLLLRDVDAAFDTYSHGEEPSITDEEFGLIEKFVVHMYYPTSDSTSVNTTRRVLFTKRNRSIENIPPTQDALLQHLKRAILQTNVWTNCLNSHPDKIDPCNWGWESKRNANGLLYIPVWKTTPDASHSCKELLACKCKERCTRCRCVKNDLSCTLLCACEGSCSREN